MTEDCGKSILTKCFRKKAQRGGDGHAARKEDTRKISELLKKLDIESASEKSSQMEGGRKASQKKK